MGSPLEFDTELDKLIRSSGMTRKKFAQLVRISTASLLKVRADDPRRGKIHWTTLALVAIYLGWFEPNDVIYEDDYRIKALVRYSSISNRGRRAANW